MTRRSGFQGERIRVLSQAVAGGALEHPVTSHLLVTDCGFFPAADHHRRSRPAGAAQAIIIVCSEGSGWCDVAGVRHEVGPGECLVIPPGVPHVYGSDAASPWTVWWLHVTGSDVSALLGAIGRRVVVGVPRLSLAIELVDEALSALETDDSPTSLMAASGAAWHLMAILASGRNRPQAGQPDPVAIATAVLRQDLGLRLTVPDIARRVGLSASRLSYLFRREYGCGPHAYLKRLRMGHARELLDTTDMSIGSIARQVGYPDPMYFAREFKAAHGMTASRYRQRDKG